MLSHACKLARAAVRKGLEAERYRDGAKAFVDRILFQKETEECLLFLKATLAP